MASYAALVSLMDLIEQIQHHPTPPLSLDRKQAESLGEKIRFLQGFLEDFHSRGFAQEIQGLESRLADVAHAAEDVIESQILLAAQGIKLRKRRWIPEIWSSSRNTDLYRGLQRVIKDLKLIEKEVDTEKKKRPTYEDDDDQLLLRRSLLPPPLENTTTTTTMVGFDNICIKIMDRLTRNESRKLDIVPIVGMGGAGKTTLARNIYVQKLIMEHFDTRSWVTISQECVAREVLIGILVCQSNPRSMEELSQESEADLGKRLYQSLIGRKYLIVMDDVWSIEVWDRLKSFFPDKNNGSRIMVTTRLSNLAFDLTGSHSRVVKMDPLDEDASWELLCKKAFIEKGCPHELEEIGKTIARNCRGLPLSIVTIGGLLEKSDMTRDYWEYVAYNLSSLINSEDDERCLSILSLSYNHLPVHLKPCFLYIGLSPKGETIQASRLIRLWVAEGFLKPISGKALEVVGEDYLKDLFERNLVSCRWGYVGKIKYCVVHDLLRDLCVRKAHVERFFSVGRFDILRRYGISKTQRRIVIHRRVLNDEGLLPNHGPPYSPLLLRSCIIGSQNVSNLIPLRSVQLLRILAGVCKRTDYTVEDIVPLVNSRFLSLRRVRFPYISPLWSMSWNLQTLEIIANSGYAAPLDIWNMPQLRHVKIRSCAIYLMDPPPSSSVDGGQLLHLGNLQTLSTVTNFKCSEEVVKRIPNVKRLGISYYENKVRGKTSMDYYLNNLGRLQNLESLAIECSPSRNWSGFTLPYSLKKLTLDGTGLNWDNDMSTMIGSLPLLEVLKLERGAFIGNQWSPIEGQFCRLKFLALHRFYDLEYLNADNTHFPRLEHLEIAWMPSLEEFPSGFGNIPTLQVIALKNVRDSVHISAKRMLEEQEEQFGNATLLVRVTVWGQEQVELMESLASNNFKVERFAW